MNQRLTRRLAIGLFAIAILLGLFQYLRHVGPDPDFGSVDTEGQIAAIQVLDDGSQAVIFEADGTKKASPDRREGRSDRELAWRADGNRLYLISDRDHEGFQLYRWNSGSQRIDRQMAGRRSVGNLFVDPATGRVLVTGGGFVLEFEPKEKTLRQVLPPIASRNGRAMTAEGGAGDQFEAMYRKFGQSFREARLAGDGEWIVAIVRNEAGHEVLVAQRMSPVQDQNTKLWSLEPPMPLISGDRVDFDVSKDGTVVFTVQRFRFVDPSDVPPEFIKEGKAVPPYRHAVIALKLDQRGDPAPLGVSVEDAFAFGRPKLDPAGTTVALEVGAYDMTTGLQVKALIAAPVATGGVNEAVLLAQTGREASWSPDGERVAYVAPTAEGRAVYVVRREGGEPRRISTGPGTYARPAFSPQVRRARGR